MLGRRVIIAAAGLLVAAGAASPAAAGQGVGLEGSFNGRSYNTCLRAGASYDPPVRTVTGTWRVNLHDTKATARFVIYVDGALHVAYTIQMQREPGPGSVFTATAPTTGAGPLEVKLVGHALTYTIEPYTDPFGGGFTCASVVYTGTAG